MQINYVIKLDNKYFILRIVKHARFVASMKFKGSFWRKCCNGANKKDNCGTDVAMLTLRVETETNDARTHARTYAHMYARMQHLRYRYTDSLGTILNCARLAVVWVLQGQDDSAYNRYTRRRGSLATIIPAICSLHRMTFLNSSSLRNTCWSRCHTVMWATVFWKQRK